MRLTAQPSLQIRKAVQKHFGKAARVWLFGSRVHDNARGGDIDLLVEVDEVIPQPFTASIALETELQNLLGDQKIDILLQYGMLPPSPIQQIAKANGIQL